MDNWYGVYLNAQGCVECLSTDENPCYPGGSSTGANNLSGDIIDFNLPHLKTLRLRMPPALIPDFSNLPNLKTLALTGYPGGQNVEIPDFSNLPLLEELIVFTFKLNGSIPDFSNLPNLKTLRLNGNSSLASEIPNFSNLPNLEGLYLYDNSLEGTVPDFANLPNLIYLNLTNNELQGVIPDFPNLPNLELLLLSENNFEGAIPNFSNLPLLTSLHISENNLVGPIPNFTNLSNLENLVLRDNQLNGNIPDFANLPNLERLGLQDNQLVGIIPNFINQPNLEYLELQNNQLEGSIPAFNNLSNLISLDLSSNQLSGVIPEFDNLTSLVNLWLSSNQLVGTIPILNNSQNLNRIDAANNRLNDLIPIPNIQEPITFGNDLLIQGNELTFEDLTPNFEALQNLLGSYFTYAPQDTINLDSTYTAPLGQAFTIDLGIDDTVTTSTYYWYKDDVLWDSLDNNKLTFDPVTPDGAGEYRVEITNSIVTDLTIHASPFTLIVECPVLTTSIDTTICNGQTIEIGDSTYTVSGAYNNQLQTSFGCDSTVSLQLNVLPAIATNFADSFCEGTDYIWNDSTYQAPGEYEQVFTAQNGCDSTVTLELTELSPIFTSFTDQFCADTEFIWGDSTYNEAGIYQQTFPAQNGCDSTVTLTLTLNPTSQNLIPATICQGQSYILGDSTYTQAGNYEQILMAENGCDSILTLQLEVVPNITYTFQDAFCEGEAYDWNGTIYDAPGTYEQVFPSSLGCDSNVTLNLGVIPLNASNLDTTICEGDLVEINGAFYDQDVIITIPDDTGLNCDSTVILTVDYFPQVVATLELELSPGESFLLRDQIFDEDQPSGAVVLENTAANGCDSIVMVSLTFKEREERLVLDDEEEVFIPGNGGTYILPVDPDALPPDPTINFYVYNRWRKKVYEEVVEDGRTTGWTGQELGKQALPAGTYFVVLRFSDDKEDNYTVTILR